MTINIDYTGQVAKGALEQINKTRDQFVNQQNADSTSRNTAVNEKQFDFSKLQKEKEAFQGQFKTALDQGMAILNSTNDPKRREAAMQLIQRLGEVYTGPVAQQYGLVQTNAKMIEFALQNPTVQEQGAAAGTMQGSSQQANYDALKVAGQPTVNAQQGAGIYVAPQSTSARGIDPVTGERKLTAAEQKEVFDNVDSMQSGQAAIDALSQASLLLDGGVTKSDAKPYSGIGSDMRTIAARVPVLGDIVAEPERGTATTDYSDLVKNQAVASLKATFGAMPTEGERKVLLDLQAISKYSEPEQRRIIANAIKRGQDRIEFNRRKTDAITRGDYSAMSTIYDDGSAAPAAPDLGEWKVEEIQ